MPWARPGAAPHPRKRWPNRSGGHRASWYVVHPRARVAALRRRGGDVKPSIRSLRLWRAATLALLIGLFATAPAGAGPKDHRFRITDELGPDQIEELIAVGIDGRTVGVLHVTKDDPIAELQVKVPAGRTVRYEL